jgi:predicted alpha/beta-fold hydrolase
VRPFAAPRWLPGGHAQTIWPLLRKDRPPAYRRERWETPDGDFIDVDRIDVAHMRATRSPLAVLFHGLEGSSHSHYARALMHAAQRRGWRGAVVHFRGCSGQPNRLSRGYHSGDSAEIDWVLRRLRSEQPAGPLFATGVSLGANALLKWLGEWGNAAHKVVDAAAGISAPLDLAAANEALSHGFGLIYARHFLRTLIPSALAKLARHPGLFDATAVRASRTLRDFDDVITGPLHGFRDAADYYARSSSGPFLTRIAIPTLVLNARNDPFLPAAALPTRASDAVILEQPDEGGHVGFVSGPFPGHISWMPERVMAHFEASGGMR